MRRPALAAHGWSIAAATLVLAVFIATLASMPRHVFWSPDEGGKFYQLASLRAGVAGGREAPYPAAAIDPGRRFYPRGPNPGLPSLPYPSTAPDGGVHFQWPIYFPLAVLPFFSAFGIDGLYVVPLLSGWLIAVLSGVVAHALSRRLAAPAILVVGLATPVWFYSLTFWEHTPAVCLIMLAVAILVRSRAGSWPALPAIIALAGLATLLRIELALLAAALVAAWLGAAWSPATRNRLLSSLRAIGRPPLLVTAAVVALLAILAVAQLPPRHLEQLASLPFRIVRTLGRLEVAPWSLVSVFVETARDESPPFFTHWGWAMLACLSLCSAAPFVRRPLAEAALILPGLIGVLAFSLDRLLLEQPYRALHGLVPVAPFVALWVYAIPLARRRPRLRRLTHAALLYLALAWFYTFVFRTNSYGGVVNGLEWGPRYLLAAYPLLAVLVLAALDRYRRSRRPAWLRAAVAALALLAIVVANQLEVRGITMLRANRTVLAAWSDALQSEGAVVTDIWWLPAAVAPLAVRQPVSFAEAAAFAQFADVAVANGARRVTTATLHPIGDDPFAGRLLAADDGSRVVQRLHLNRFVAPDPDRQ
jgi:hypothetical protein